MRKGKGGRGNWEIDEVGKVSDGTRIMERIPSRFLIHGIMLNILHNVHKLVHGSMALDKHVAWDGR